MKDNKVLLAPLKGTLTAYIITVLVFIIYALLLTYTQISEKNNSAVVLITLSVSLIIGGIKSSASAKQKGLISGAITGVLYVALMIAAGFFIIPGYTLGTRTLLCMLLAIGSGGIGGIIGVNLFAKG